MMPKLTVGVNDLASQHPDIAAEWHPTKNEGLTATDVTRGSGREVWWFREPCGHEWVAPVHRRTNMKTGCPYCTSTGRKRILPGFNDLATKSPYLASQWHPTKNGSRRPEATAPTFKGDVWWVCERGHEFQASVVSRYLSDACQVCRMEDTSVSNDALLVAQWDSERNDRTVSEVSLGSPYEAWWLCSEGHSWQSAVYNRSGGRGCAVCAGKKVVLGVNDLATLRPDIARSWDDGSNGGLRASDVTVGSGVRVTWSCDNGHRWVTSVSDRTRPNGSGCPTCAAKVSVSRGEIEVARFVTSLGLSYVSSLRGTPGVTELDIALPDLGVALEYNGLYWHCESHRSRDYHRTKSLAAERAGYQVLHVWEDDWAERRSVVERMIARKLGASDETRYNARSLDRVRLSAGQARSFLEANHIQGFVSGSEYLALRGEGGIRAVMVLKRRKEGSWELVRFATDGIVRGGFSRLFKWFQALHPEVVRVVTFADRGVSDGGLYANNGFVRDGEIAPDYMYVVRGHREHKFNYRKARFKSDPNLQYEEGLTERQLAELNKLPRIWDAGKVRWAWNAKTPSA